jgi:NitT/TauT family transport system permease protein/taurine transport system permease protein
VERYWEVTSTWFVILAASIAVWSLASATLPVPDYFLPPPSAVLSAFAELMTKGMLPTFIGESLRRILIAALLGLFVGVPLGLLLGISRGTADFAYPLLNFFQSVSGIAWLPLMLIWFGFGERTILVAVNYTVFFRDLLALGHQGVPQIWSSFPPRASRWRTSATMVRLGSLRRMARVDRRGCWWAPTAGFMIFNARPFISPRALCSEWNHRALWVVLDYLFSARERRLPLRMVQR